MMKLCDHFYKPKLQEVYMPELQDEKGELRTQWEDERFV
jgi:hypothetical protein